MVSPLFSRRFVSSRFRSVDRIDEETLSDSDPVRHCPIEPGSTLDQSYTAIVKLGYGRTSTAWLCKDSKSILCDLGSAVFDEARYPGVVQALPYRAPEVILGAAWDHKIDIWNFGVLVWKLFFTKHLFGNSDERRSIESMIRYISTPPKGFLELCRHYEAFFDEKGNRRHGTIDAVRLEGRIEEGTSIPELLDFLRCALRWDPRERSSAAQLPKHAWLKIALPEDMKCRGGRLELANLASDGFLSSAYLCCCSNDASDNCHIIVASQSMLLRQDSLPPSYAVATLNDTSAPVYQEITERAPGFQYFQRTTRHIKIFDALDSNEPHYLMAEAHELDKTSIKFYRGNDKNRPASGQAIFSKATKDFIIAVDGPERFAFPEQELVQCVNSHNYFRTDIYRFAVPGGSYFEQNQAEARNLVWKHTHNSNLGSAAWKSKDFKLMDEATEQTIAIYIHMSESKNVTGRLEWKIPYSFNEEIRALIVLMAFLIRT